MMNSLHAGWVIVAGTFLLAGAGCDRAPGYPKESAEISRPDKQLDFHTL